MWSLGFYISVSLFSSVLCVTKPEETLLPQSSSRIVGGSKSYINAFPWQVSLQRYGHHFCGGSIYAPNIVVTAAHCLESTSVAALRVRAGSSSCNSGGILVSVAAFRQHEHFNINTVVNDIAVVRLSAPLSYSSVVRNIPLALHAPHNGASAVASGWGITSYGSSKAATDLQSVQLRILSRQVCGSPVFGYGARIQHSMICGYAVNKDACKGDSGGPLVSAGVLVGVISWGMECASRSYPGVYADVSVLRSWVEDAVRTL